MLTKPMRKTLKLTDLCYSSRRSRKAMSLERWWINFEVFEGSNSQQTIFQCTIFVTLIIHRPEIDFSLCLYSLGTFHSFVDHRIIFDSCKMLDRSAAFSTKY